MSPGSHPYNPFDLAREADYRHWREDKLADYPDTPEQLMIQVGDPAALNDREQAAILGCCRKTNMAIYCGTRPADKHGVRALGRCFGLERLDMNLRADEDSITSLRVVPAGTETHYIPYTNHRLNWHTDGYYNRPGEQVRGIVMHCVRPAVRGGTSLLMDPEIAYILLRDRDPAWIEALMQPDAMTIPANIEGGVEIRPVQSGPVFSVENRSLSLHMRYTTRVRHIIWKDDEKLRQAVGFLRELLDSDTRWIFRYRLQAGEGIICNNVLHAREAFEDDGNTSRLLYRARYHDRIRGTEMTAKGFGGRHALAE